MLTCQAIVKDLLTYIGVQQLDPIPEGTRTTGYMLSQSDINRALASVNGALQEIYAAMPAVMKRQQRSCFFNAPTPLTLALTQYGTTATVVSGWASWMVQCAIVIPGDQYINQIVGINSDATTVTLLRAYLGASATQTATVYADACLLASDVKSVIAPVQTSIGFRPLWPCTDRRSFSPSLWKMTGIPRRYIVDTYANTALTYNPYWLRVTPMPLVAMNVSFDAELQPVEVTSAAIGTDESDPNYYFTSLPQEWCETILLPVARKNFMTHPAFNNASAAQQIQEGYDNALGILRGTNPLPMTDRTRAHYL